MELAQTYHFIHCLPMLQKYNLSEYTLISEDMSNGLYFHFMYPTHSDKPEWDRLLVCVTDLLSDADVLKGIFPFANSKQACLDSAKPVYTGK